MPTPSQFEEKEYEFPLYNELLHASRKLWTPGQVLEGYLGFDAALSVANNFWAVVQRPAVDGVRLARYGLSPMLRRRRSSAASTEPLPDFTINLFLQVKRPSEYQQAPAEVQAVGLGTPTWFFEIESHQQVLLEKLAAHLGNLADVSYASAAFITKKKLWSLQQEKGLVPNSTFPPAIALRGHDRWAYDCGGACGVGFSEPERMDIPPLLKRVAELASRHPRPLQPAIVEGEQAYLSEDELRRLVERRSVDLVPQLERLWDAIMQALKAWTPEQARLAETILSAAAEFGDDLSPHSQLIAKISTATAYLGLRWLVVGPGEHEG